MATFFHDIINVVFWEQISAQKDEEDEEIERVTNFQKLPIERSKRQLNLY